MDENDNENDDNYAEDPDFDEEQPIKPKKRTQINTDSILSIKVSEKTHFLAADLHFSFVFIKSLKRYMYRK